MDIEQALEMVEALLADNENAISTLGDYGDEVAIALYEKIRELEGQH